MTELDTASIEKRYGFRVAHSSSPLGGGYENDIFRISTAHGRFAARICAPWITADRVSAEHDVVSFMSGRVPEVHRPVTAVDGTTWFEQDGRVVCVFPLVHGQAMNRDDEELRRAGAELLARIHRAGLDYLGEGAVTPFAALDWTRNPYWDLDKARATLAAMASSESSIAQRFAAEADRIEAEQRWVNQRRAELYEMPLVMGVVHGDYWPGNILAEHGRITGVIDWLGCRRDQLVIELGRAVWEFCSDRDEHTLLRDRARAFLDAYVAGGGPVPADEFRFLVDVMRFGIIGDVLYDLTYQPNPEEVAAYHIGSLRGLDYLASLEAL